MSWWYAAATFAAGTIGEVTKKQGKYGIADERNRAARESLLTAKYNIRERNKESRQTQFQVLETGGNLSRQIAIEGKRAEGAATVAGATSGALVETGSTRAALTNIIQESISAQTDAIIDTKNRIKAIARDTTNKNTSEWRNARLHKVQQDRVAGAERKSADREFLAGMIKTGVKTYGAYKTASGWSKSSVDTDTKAITTGSSKGPAGMTEGPTGKYLKTGVGPTGKYASVASTANAITSKKVIPMKGYSMNKIRPTGGAESSSTWDRLVHQMKTRKLDFSRKGFNDMWDFSKGRRNSPWWNFISGKGFSGKAQPGRMRGASR